MENRPMFQGWRIGGIRQSGLNHPDQMTDDSGERGGDQKMPEQSAN
jgi:hypothetical protein